VNSAAMRRRMAATTGRGAVPMHAGPTAPGGRSEVIKYYFNRMVS